MPNHTMNILTLSGPMPELKTVVQAITNTEGEIDFNRILPCPEILTQVISPVRRGPSGRIMLHHDDGTPFGSHHEASEDEQAAYDQAVADNPDITPFGGSRETISWYEWCTERWGTKWNAYSQDPVEFGDHSLTYRFNTAWDAPRGYYAALLETVRRLAPNVTVEAVARFEDDGYRRCETIIDGERADA